jgi:diguanylate cyclase (GGDEF)-like protein
MIGDPLPHPHSDESQRRQLLRLRFDSPLEALFREQFERNARTPRALILVLGMVMIALTPLYDRTILNAPDAFLDLSHFLQYGLQIPAIAVALLFTIRPTLYRWSPAMMTLSCLVTGSGVMAQYIIGRRMGFDVPHDFTAITVSAMLILGRLRFWWVLPWALLLMIGTTWAQMQAFGLPVFYDAVSAWMLASISAVTAYLLEYAFRESWYRGRLLEFQASRDSLTGLPNRRHFDQELRKLVCLGSRNGGNLALLLLDIDHFKDYNDRHGHPAGDQCLRMVGAWLGSAMRRPQDFCARIGGEEFAAVWFDARPDSAIELAEALRAGVRALAIDCGNEGGGCVSASGGFAQVIALGADAEPDQVASDLLKRADGALYAAKHAGRGRLVQAGAPTPAEDVAEVAAAL